MSDDLTEELGQNIPLFEMIQTVRTELQAAVEAAKEQSLRFRVESVELELQVVLSQETKGKGGIKFWVLAAEGEHAAKKQATHTFKVKLQPLLEDPANTQPSVTSQEGKSASPQGDVLVSGKVSKKPA